MSTPSGWQRKLLLLVKSEKRLGAKQIHQAYADKDFTQMKKNIIRSDQLDPIDSPDKPRIKDLSQHLNKVKHEFIGKSELEFYHATLIVLIRRGYKCAEMFAQFEQLWEQETAYLLSHLSLRWIVSACDTFVDHAKSPTRASILMNVVTLINTLKVYETHIFLHQSSQFEPTLNHDRVESLYQQHLPLYDDLTYFRIGTDDTLKNMRQRYEGFNVVDKMATTMLLFVFDELQKNQSAFFTLKSLHKDDKSTWW